MARKLFFILAALTAGIFYLVSHSGPEYAKIPASIYHSHSQTKISAKKTTTPMSMPMPRKLLLSGEGRNSCSKNDIALVEGELPRQPSGIPTYVVEITNTCASGCSISDIHLNCGGFSSSNLISPAIFRHIPNSDQCLVNDGKPLKSGQMVSFRYTTNFRYKFSVSSFKC